MCGNQFWKLKLRLKNYNGKKEKLENNYIFILSFPTVNRNRKY